MVKTLIKACSDFFHKLSGSGRNAAQRFEQIDLIALRYNLNARTNDYAWLADVCLDRKLVDWIGSMDYNGYTREHCLRSLVDHFQSSDEHWILRRLSDWVPQVRRHANRWLEMHWPSMHFNIVLANQDVLLRAFRSTHTDVNAIALIRADLFQRALTLPPALFYCFAVPMRLWLYQQDAAFGVLHERLRTDPAQACRLLLIHSKPI
jgi:hypothetical protein